MIFSGVVFQFRLFSKLLYFIVLNFTDTTVMKIIKFPTWNWQTEMFIRATVNLIIGGQYMDHGLHAWASLTIG